MKKLICFCAAAALMAGCICGCSNKTGKTSQSTNTTEASTTEASSENTTVTNDVRKFLGKWESYKATVGGVDYETDYSGYPLSAVMKLEIFEDNTAHITTALNPRGKERTSDYYKWNITSMEGNDVLHVVSPDDRYDCRIEQGQMIVRYADYDDGTEIFLFSVDKFSEPQSTTEAGLDKVDYSAYFGKWESEEVTSYGETYTETMGDYPVNVAFRFELNDDNSAVLSIFGEPLDYQWEAQKKDELYMWNDYEGFAITLNDGILTLDSETGLVIKLHSVEEFSDYDFSAAADSAPDDDAILNPEETEETT